MAYATVDDYRELHSSDMDDVMLQAWLDKASRKIDAAIARRGAELPEDMDDALAGALSDACIDMVRRVVGDGTSAIPDGATSWSQGANGFTESYSFAAYSSLKLRADELDDILALLGVHRGGICYTSVLGGE